MALLSSNWKQLIARQTEEKKVAATANVASLRNANANTNGTKPAAAPTAAIRGAHRKHKRVDRTAAPTKAAAAKEPVLAALEDDKSGPLPTCVAMDCEMVGVGAAGATSALARCSIVDFAGGVLYDKHVRPVEKVVDYRTAVSGIEPRHIHGPGAVDFKVCQIEVAAILNNRVLVGHALQHDLAALLLSHPRHLIRDTSKHKGLCPRKPRSLKALVAERLGISIQSGKHDSVEDARSVMAIYKQLRKQWEKDIAAKHSKRNGHHNHHNSTANTQLTKKEVSMMAADAAANAAIDAHNNPSHNISAAAAVAAAAAVNATNASTANGVKRKQPSTSTPTITATATKTTTATRTSKKGTTTAVSNTSSALKVTFSRPNKRPRSIPSTS